MLVTGMCPNHSSAPAISRVHDSIAAGAANYGHAPQELITVSRSAVFTIPSPPGGAISGKHVAGGMGHAPQALMTASRSAVLTVPSPPLGATSASHGTGSEQPTHAAKCE